MTGLITRLLVMVLLAVPIDAQEAMPAPPRAPVPILMLGTFHFDDAGLDAYRPEHRLDVLSPERQREIERVADCLAKFRPTKVAVEAPLDAAERINARYRAFVAGEPMSRRNEIDQLGFRVARAMGHSQVYPVDAKGRWYEPSVDLERYAADKGQLERLLASETPWEQYYKALYAQGDALKMRQTLRQHLLDGNRREDVLLSHGSYLVGTFKVGMGDEYPGVDAKTAWYNRNLRIFANLQRITSGPDERIFLLIGSGHLPILWHAAETSPEYVRVPVDDVLGSACDAPPVTPAQSRP
jgi:hypothetical protein